jgi:hypothetical protein
MRDDQQLERLLEVATVASLGGLLLGVAKIIIHEKYGTAVRFFRGAVSSVTVAVLAAFALADSGLSLLQQWALIGLLSYVADDVLNGFLILGKLFAHNPISFLKDLWSSLRGGGKS